MAKRITVVVSQGQSVNPAKRQMEEDVVAGLLGEPGIDVTVVPHLYDLQPDGTGMLCLQGISEDLMVLAWLFPRAIRWTLDRHGIHGREGTTLLVAEDEDEQFDEEQDDEEDAKLRVLDSRRVPDRLIYCIDLRLHNTAQVYIDEVKRIVAESQASVVELTSWIEGTPKPEQMQRYLDPSAGLRDDTPPPPQSSSVPVRIQEGAARRWYPVIDYSRCTNCMECIDFCLFGVYGIDNVDTLLVEQPDNCRKGCPACSRVCPENAIIFPQHKTPAIAGSPGAVDGLKIDLSKLFGKPEENPLEAAVRERDEQLVLAGRGAVGMTKGMPKRQSGATKGPKDDLDNLIDEVDAMDL